LAVYLNQLQNYLVRFANAENIAMEIFD